MSWCNELAQFQSYLCLSARPRFLDEVMVFKRCLSSNLALQYYPCVTQWFFLSMAVYERCLFQSTLSAGCNIFDIKQEIGSKAA